MRRIDFIVEGAPPKKDGANSMWNKGSERLRLIELRRAAVIHLGDNGPLTSNIRLDVQIHWPRSEIDTVGDLDNFITGICDGLMAASRGTPIGEDWNSPKLKAIHPSRSIAIRDDRAMIEITARKVPSDMGERWYRIVLVGE